MAKATIIFEDVGEEQVSITVEFDPPPEDSEDLTQAQHLCMSIASELGIGLESNDDSSNEGGLN